MQWDELERILKDTSIPDPSAEAKTRAKTEALSEFARLNGKNEEVSKGSPEGQRQIVTVPTGMANLIRRLAMKKHHMLAGGIAVCALAVVLTNTTILSGGINLPTDNKPTEMTNTPPQSGLIEPESYPYAKPEEEKKESSVLQKKLRDDEAKGYSSSKTDRNKDAESNEGLAVALQSEAGDESKTSDRISPFAPPPPPAMIAPPPPPPPPALAASGAAGSMVPMKTQPYPKQERRLAATTEEMQRFNEQDVKAKKPRSELESRAVAVGNIAAEAMMIAPPPVDVVTSSQQYQGNDKFEDIKVNPVKLVAEEPVSTLSTDVDTSSYSFMRRELNHGNLPQKDAVRVEELINYFDYNYALPESKAEPFKPTVAVYPTPWNKNTKLLHIGIKGYDIDKDRKPLSNLVFLLDVSGSMDEPQKLPLLKNAFKLMVDSLSPEDKVSIVVYAGSVGTVLEPTKVIEKSKIIAALDNLQAGGSTAGGEGIRRAYELAEANFNKEGVNRVILATDGDFNVGITDTEELKGFIERKRDTGIFLSVLGFGQGNYNDELMQKLAQNGNGNAAYIDTLNEARKVLVDEASSTLFPIAKDVKFQVEFNPNLVSEYRLIGYETRLLNREDFNNDKVDAGDMGAGHSVTAIYEITPKGSISGFADPLRYGKMEGKPVLMPVMNETDGIRHEVNSNEYAFLKMRYKLPNQDKSKLIERPITKSDEVDGVDRLPVDVKFAASVAAYGQLLRGDPYIHNYTYDDVLSLAESSKGEDRFGYRAEFINLVRLAKSMKPIESLR